jgi:hypothetical protein
MIETITKGQSFVSFDVSLSGHVISTISARHQGGHILWCHASIHGFDDFDPSDRNMMEKKIRDCWSARAGQAQVH